MAWIVNMKASDICNEKSREKFHGYWLSVVFHLIKIDWSPRIGEYAADVGSNPSSGPAQRDHLLPLEKAGRARACPVRGPQRGPSRKAESVAVPQEEPVAPTAATAVGSF